MSVLLVVLMLALGHAAPQSGLVASQVLFEQELRPKLIAQRERAKARVSAFEVEGRGADGPGQIWPELRGLDLSRLSVRDALRAECFSRGVRRADYAHSPAPVGLSTPDEQSLFLLRAEVQALEAEADRRILVFLADIERNQAQEIGLSEPLIETERRRLDGRIQERLQEGDALEAGLTRRARLADQQAYERTLWSMLFRPQTSSSALDIELANLQTCDDCWATVGRLRLLQGPLSLEEEDRLSVSLLRWVERMESTEVFSPEGLGPAQLEQWYEHSDYFPSLAVASRWNETVAASRAEVAQQQNTATGEAEINQARHEAAAELERSLLQATEAKDEQLMSRRIAAQERLQSLLVQADDDRDARQTRADEFDSEMQAFDARLQAIRRLFWGQSEKADALLEEVRIGRDGAELELLEAHHEVWRTRERDRIFEALLKNERGQIRNGYKKIASDRSSVDGSEQSLETWAVALDKTQNALDTRWRRLLVRRTALAAQVDQVRAAHATVEALAGSGSLNRDRQVVRLQREIELLPAYLSAITRGRLQDYATLPGRLNQLSMWWECLRGGAQLGLLIFLVALGRDLARRLSQRGERWVQSRWVQMGTAEIAHVGDLFNGILRASFLILAIVSLNPSIGAFLPELRFSLILYAWYLVLTVVRRVLTLLVVSPDEARPALWSVGVEGRELTTFAVTSLFTWLVSLRMTAVVLSETLGLYALSSLVFSFLHFGMWVASAVLIYRMEPFLRLRLRRLSSDLWLVRTLGEGPASSPLRVPYGVFGLLFLLVFWAWNAVQNQATERRKLGRLISALVRFRAGWTDRESAREPLSEGMRPRVTFRAPFELERRVETSALLTCFEQWRSGDSTGIAMLIGDRGDGASALCRSVLLSFDLPLSPVVFAPVERLTERGQLIAFLSRGLGVEPPPTVDDLIQLLLGRPPQVFVLMDFHRFFLKSVGGFSAIRALISLFHETAGRHFWLVSVHRPAWSYLQRLGNLVDLGVFQTIISIEPIDEREVEALCVAQIEAESLTLDFSLIAGGSLLGVDPEVEEERARAVFFRLLAEASGGNPQVVSDLWLSCVADNGINGVRPYVHRCLQQSLPTGLGQAERFLLVALRTMDLLNEGELVRVTNMAPGLVRMSLKRLISNGFIDEIEDEFWVKESRQLGVTRMLRRDHFIQWVL